MNEKDLQEIRERYERINNGDYLTDKENLYAILDLATEDLPKLLDEVEFLNQKLENAIDNEIETATRLQKERDEWKAKAEQYGTSLWEVSNTLEGENVTPLVENLAYVLGHSGVYDKDGDSE